MLVNIPTDAASTNYGDGWSTCGDRTYALTDVNGDTPAWVTAHAQTETANQFIIRVAIDDESYVGSPHTMTLTVGFATYPVADDADHPTATFTFDINVENADCDCSLITWNEPENIPIIMQAMVVTTPTSNELLEAGPLESSLTATTGSRACDLENDECEYAYTITARMLGGDPLYDWIVYE